MKYREVWYNGKHYEFTVDSDADCNSDCENCPHCHSVGEDNFLEFCGKTGEVL